MSDPAQQDWKSMLAGARVGITGVCGSVGGELLRQVLACEPEYVIGLDNNESSLFFLWQEFHGNPALEVAICDLRDMQALETRLRGLDIVLHAAALKHVPLCEDSPLDAIQTNIIGTQNVIDAAARGGAKRVLFTSSDKAVNPTNVMGTSKLMAERLVTAANSRPENDGVIMASTRFGNVLGSRGSVIPLFAKQIETGGPITITDPDMSRFIMTLPQAVELVLRSAFLAEGGEVFITKMPVIRIDDLAAVMVDILAPQFGHDPASIELKVVGTRPGEKLFEELMNSEETRRSADAGDFIVVHPAIGAGFTPIERDESDPLSDPYNSHLTPPMSRDELREYLIVNNLLEGTEVNG